MIAGFDRIDGQRCCQPPVHFFDNSKVDSLMADIRLVGDNDEAKPGALHLPRGFYGIVKETEIGQPARRKRSAVAKLRHGQNPIAVEKDGAGISALHHLV